jgi:hypothetical protein
LKARRLMISSTLSVEVAAFKVGYESPSQFSREYSCMFGSTPEMRCRANKVSAHAGIDAMALVALPSFHHYIRFQSTGATTGMAALGANGHCDGRTTKLGRKRSVCLTGRKAAITRLPIRTMAGIKRRS